MDIEALRLAASWPNADPRTALLLAGLLLAAHRYQEGYEYFAERYAENPDRALYLSLAGACQARLDGAQDDAVAKLDEAAAREPGLPHYFRGVTLADLPGCAGRPETAVQDLEFVLAIKDRFPPGLLRAVHRGLAAAYNALGRTADAAAALGGSGLAPGLPTLVTNFWGTPAEGLRFVPPRLVELARDVHVAQGYDFSDLAFVLTGAGVVAIDAGSSRSNARAALAALRAVTGDPDPVSHVILTHAHWDHVGGVEELTADGAQVIAQHNFPDELRLVKSGPPPIPYLRAAGETHLHDFTPDRLVEGRQTVTLGGVDFDLHPVYGGETRDGLLVHLPDRGAAFVGDMTMPQLGAPFLPEGSAEGLFEAMQLVIDLEPEILIHGHAGLTENYTIEAFPGLLGALRDLHEFVKSMIVKGRTLAEVLHGNHLPPLLRDHPAAVLPYLVTRDNFIQRVYDQNTGYWKPGGEDIEIFDPSAWAAALDLLGGGSPQAFLEAGRRLTGQGDHALALRIVESGRLCHPKDPGLEELRGEVLHRLVERYQLTSPFKFAYYAGLAGLELPHTA